MKEREKPGKVLLPHGIILLELREFSMFMEDNASGIQHESSFGSME
jgi:hypothetical protein